MQSAAGGEDRLTRSGPAGRFSRTITSGHRQQVLSAGTTVMVRVTTHFQAEAKDEWLTLRLAHGRETARIGEITVAPPPP